MLKRKSSVLTVLFLLVGSTPSLAQHKREVIEQGKKATALVEVKTAEGGATGSAFCVDKSGLFVTNAHVVDEATGGKAEVGLVLDVGLKTQRSVSAKVLRADDLLDLALLKIDPDPRLTPLELGKDEALFETAPVVTFGFPLGRNLRVRPEALPNVTVIASKITALHRPKDRLEAIQFDNQLNPGHSGGPVVDETGRVIGVAVATIPGKALNLAVAVGRLSEFLTAPGVVFDPAPLRYVDRARPVTWTIKLEPPAPGTELPGKLSVDVTVAHSKDDRRKFTAKPLGGGVFEVRVTPVPTDPPTPPQVLEALVETKQGSVVLATVHRRAEMTGAPPRVAANTPIEHDILIIPVIPQMPGIGRFGMGRPGLGGFGRGIPGMGGFDRRVPGMGGRDSMIVVVPRNTRPPLVRVPQNTNDDRLLELGGVLNVDGIPRGAGKTIRPPKVDIGAARLGSSADYPGPIRTFDGHTSGLWSVAMSADGSRLLTASHDGTVRLWDVQTGRQLKVMAGHTDHVKRAAFLPDGVRGISAADDDTLRLWDLKTGREVRQFVGHTADVESLAVSRDGSRVISFAQDRTMRLWDVETGRELGKPLAHADHLNVLNFMPDGSRALTASGDGIVRLWDLGTNRELRQFNPHAGLVSCVAVSPDGRLAVAGCQDGTVRVWEVESGREVGRLTKHDDGVQSVVFSTDGRRVCSGGGDKDRTIRVWDVAGGRELQCLRGLGTAVPRLALSPDGRTVVLTRGAIAELWALPDRVPPAENVGTPLVRSFENKIHDVAVGGGGRYLILTVRDARKLAVFDVNTADVIKTIELPSGNVLVAAGATMLVIGSLDEGVFERWDLETMTRQGARMPSPIKGRLKGLAMGSDSDGPLLAVWSPDLRNNIREQARFSFLDTKTFKVLKAGPITSGGLQGIGSVSASGGSIRLHPFIQNRVHVRAAAGGDLFGIWHTDSSPSGFQTLAVRRATLRGIYNHDAFDHLAPGPDGHTVYTGRAGALDENGKPVRGDHSRPAITPELSVPSADAAYYLSINGLSGNTAPHGGRGTDYARLTASVHAAGDGTRLLIVGDLDEMDGARINESSIQDDFTVEKRFHFVPAANLFVTIPFANDRLVLRRLDIRKALDKLGADYLVVTTPCNLYATAGTTFNHQIEAFAKAGGIQYTVGQGPDGLTVSPTGKLTWLPPSSSASGDVVTAVVTVADSAGTERFHTLRIRVK